MSSLVAAEHEFRVANRRAERALRGHMKRRVARVEIVLLVFIAVLLVLGACATLNRGSSTVALREVRVELGQTAWSLAEAHPAPGRSTAETARLITERNQLSGSGLVAGEIVMVPTGERFEMRQDLAMR